MRDGRSIPERVADLDRVEALLSRLAADPDEEAAARRVLGVEDEADRLAAAYAPDLPPPPRIGASTDHAAHARETVARYRALVDSYPDDDSTPLRERQRTLRLAELDLERLEKS